MKEQRSMEVSTRVKKVYKKYGIVGSLSYCLSVLPGVLDFYFNPWSIKKSYLPPINYDSILADLLSKGIQTIPLTINTSKFHSWLSKYSFPQSYIESNGINFIEKALEYYVGLELLQLWKGDIFIDVGAGNSPWIKMVHSHIGCKTYALDLAYPEGIHGSNIGADASLMPFLDGSVTKIAFHCSYETFEGKKDIKTIREAERVLSLGGRLVILPLYLHNSYWVDSNPWADRRGIDYDGALRVWRDDGHIVRFSRKYSVEAFVRRVKENRGDLNFSIYYIQNEKDISDNCYLKFALVFSKS
jgi:ubiquinone/menaquinone biosynthesis C-methylase UbiE